jgi:hypothetical protein
MRETIQQSISASGRVSLNRDILSRLEVSHFRHKRRHCRRLRYERQWYEREDEFSHKFMVCARAWVRACVRACGRRRGRVPVVGLRFSCLMSLLLPAYYLTTSASLYHPQYKQQLTNIVLRFHSKSFNQSNKTHPVDIPTHSRGI